MQLVPEESSTTSSQQEGQPEIGREAVKHELPPVPTQSETSQAVAKAPTHTTRTVDVSLASLGDLLTMAQAFEMESGTVYAFPGTEAMLLVDAGNVLRDRVRPVEPMPSSMFVRPLPPALLELLQTMDQTSEDVTNE